MRIRAASAILGLLLIVFAGFMAIPFLIGLAEGLSAPGSRGLGAGILLCLVVGVPLFYVFRRHLTDRSVGARVGIAITALGWIVLTAAGALPFCIGAGMSFADAYFEVMSGLTTTGSTILTGERIEHGLGSGLLFWRSFTHWIGGMGIILLTVAILPLFGAGGYQLFRAEVPGPTKDRLRPRIIETAKTLWLIYVGLTVLEVMLLWACGLSLYQSLCHAFGTLATGGFSTLGDSVKGFENALKATGHADSAATRACIAELIVVLFMFLAGCNFVLFYRALQHRSLRPLWSSSEFKVYALITASSILIMTWLLAGADSREGSAHYGFWEGLRHSVFNTVSILTTTGFGTENFQTWPSAVRVMLLLLMLCGGCAGSTAGGMKVMRLILLFKFAWRELLTIIRPRAVILIKHDGVPVQNEVLSSVLGFSVLYIVSLASGTFLMALILHWVPPISGSAGEQGALITAFTSCLATLSNVGPGLAGVGPYQNFSEIPDAGKWLLSLLMLMGRLEIFTVVALLAPNTWRK